MQRAILRISGSDPKPRGNFSNRPPDSRTRRLNIRRQFFIPRGHCYSNPAKACPSTTSPPSIPSQLHHPLADTATSNAATGRSACQPKPKPLIILINGVADPQSPWAAQLPAFTAAGYTVRTHDNRGVGVSSRPQHDTEVSTAETMARDLRSLVHAIKVPTPYHLLGVSLGGMIALDRTDAHDRRGEGEEDILIPVPLSKELHALIEGSEWRVTRGGHACMWEFPDEFNRVCSVGGEDRGGEKGERCLKDLCLGVGGAGGEESRRLLHCWERELA